MWKERTVELDTYGVVNDKTWEVLEAFGWKPLVPGTTFGGLWQCPRSGEWYAMSQAAAIVQRRTVYRFKSKPAMSR